MNDQKPIKPNPGDILYCAKMCGDRIYYQRSRVDRLTPEGFWIADIGGFFAQTKRKWFSYRTRKWSVTEADALLHLQARTWSWIGHASYSLARALRVYSIVKPEDKLEINDIMHDAHMRAAGF